MSAFDSYLAGLDATAAGRVREVIATIRRAAPQASEAIAYGMPTFKLAGKNLVHTAGFARHTGFYPTPAAITAFADELTGFRTSKGAVQFPHDEPLPTALIERMVAARVADLTPTPNTPGPTAQPTTKSANIKGIETGTGRSWESWLAFLDSIGARNLSHGEIAARVHAEGANEWWAQGVTVAYEQHIGRRAPGQQGDGSFSVTVSKTLPGDMDAVLALVAERLSGITEIAGVAFTRAATTSVTEKWRYWRCGLADGSRVSINIQTKPGGEKSLAAVNHDNLPDPDAVAALRAHWRAWLSGLA